MILVTGATGFIGEHLINYLSASKEKREIIATTRREVPNWNNKVITYNVGEITATTNWRNSLKDTSVVIHCAARAHIMKEKNTNPLELYRKINTEGTLNLARQAAETGVRRFIFISSIKVNGEGTKLGKPYTDSDHPAPIDPYGISKLEAEQGLLLLAKETGMEVTIIRPVLVYGPGVKANFLSIMKWLKNGVPLPLGSIHNKRSLVSLDNLIDLIVTCIDHPEAANQVFLVSDGEDLSTSELLRRMGSALGKTTRLVPVPTRYLEMGAALLGKRHMAQRLCGSLQVDISKTRRLLGWNPPLSVDQGLKKAAEGITK